MVVAGWDGDNVRSVQTTTDGSVVVNVPDVIKVDPENRSFIVNEESRENGEFPVLTAATRSATPAQVPLTFSKNTGLRLYLNITAAPDSTAQTLKIKVFSVDPVSTAKFPITNFSATPAANNALFTTVPQLFVYDVYVGANATGLTNYQAQSIALSRQVNIEVTHSGGDPWTYSLGATLLI